MGNAHPGVLLHQAEVRAKIVSELPDCQRCSPPEDEPWAQPNKATYTVTNELTGKRLHVCGGCLEGLAADI